MESELSRIVDALPGLVWTASAGGEIDFLDQQWFDHTGFNRDDSSGRGLGLERESQFRAILDGLPDLVTIIRATAASCWSIPRPPLSGAARHPVCHRASVRRFAEAVPVASPLTIAAGSSSVRSENIS